MKRIGLVALFGAISWACDNHDEQVAKMEAEKAKMEAEKAKMEVEMMKAQVEVAHAEAELAKAEARSNSTEKLLPKGEEEASDAPQKVFKAPKVAQPKEPEAIAVRPKLSVSVSERKSDGNTWDAMGGAPDVLVVLSGPGGSIQSGVGKNQFASKHSLGAMRLTQGDTVQITVVDKDAMQNDPIGSASVVFKGKGASSSFAGGSMSGSIEF